MNTGKRRMHAAWALAASLTVVAAIGTSLPAGAQDAPVQRQVSPGPVAASGVGVASIGPGLPATTPMTDLLTRMDALETQMARLTAQNEELANRQHQIESRPGTAPAAATTPTMGPPNDAGTTAPVASTALAPVPIVPKSAIKSAVKSGNASNLSAMTGGISDRTDEAHAAGPARASAQRIAAVKAVIKPQSRDAGLDEYSYGFRLYTAKLYPEAAQQLKLYIDKYPKDVHISHARNLLGRTYLDDGKPRDAAPWFLTNYKTDPHGPRAADSLLNLAAAMRQLGDDSRACIALNEFSANYAADAQGRLRQDYAKTRGGLTCN